MCGRFVAATPNDLLAELFEVDEVKLPEDRPRYNVAPTDDVRVVVEREGVRTLERRRWGLVPHWAGSPDEAAGHINARGETVHEMPAFRDAFARRRCLVPADGFYEWKRRDGVVLPYFIRAADSRPLAFAGLRATWSTRGAPPPVNPPNAQAGSKPLRTCAIVTTSANAALAGLHDRMPVILPRQVWPDWLDAECGDIGYLRSLLVPAPDNLLEIVPVGRDVNSVRNDGPWLVERVPDAVQGSLPF
jgi:putative SOS response-associated peptidase YedK